MSAVLAASALFTTSSLGVRLRGRDINEPLLESYDYIVVGCGISGLVVTNRLSEIASRTVLCIEAGEADRYEAIIQDPVYVGADIGGIYDWDLETVPQTQLDGNTRAMPQGKVLGGGSILNAMCWNRGGSDDFNAWEALGNPGWGWDGILPYFMKSETYTPIPSEEIAGEYSIHYNPAVHGTSGPVQVSYPRYFYPQSINLFAGMNLLGLPTQFDPNDGTSAGPAFVPTDLDPNNQTRSDARRTYFDPYVGRSNFHVITGQHVTRILIDGVSSNQAVSNPTAGGNTNGNGPSSGDNNGFGFGPAGSTPPLPGKRFARSTSSQDPRTASRRVTGVEFAPNATAPRRTVFATREVIVAAGALHSAQLLQLSGIGPSSLLAEFNIPMALDLPGVGNNLQDHCLVGTFYPYNNASYPSPTELTTNATYNAKAEQEYDTDKTGPWTAGSPNALAFNPLPLITNNSASILANASNQVPTEYLVAGLDPTIIAGFIVQKQSLVRRLAENTVAAYEIINNNAGSLTVSVMHPFSRGTCYIQSADPFQPPAIDPRWLTNPVDRQVLIEALLFNRRILATPPMLELQPAQFVPPIDADEDAINQIINNGIRTEFHPSGTLAMLPLELGGVVDSHLRVWGTRNLRVVDAGIFPVIPAAHLQAVVYGVAEKAADIIKADNLPAYNLPSSFTSSTLSANSTSRSSATGSVGLSRNVSASSYPSLSINATIGLLSSIPPKITTRILSLSSVVPSTSTTALASTPSTFPVASTAVVNSPPSTPSLTITEDSLSQTLTKSATIISQSNTASPMRTSTSSTSVMISLPGVTAMASSVASSPAEAVIVVTKTLPSTLPALLSSLDIARKSELLPTSIESPSQAGQDPQSYQPFLPPGLSSHEKLSTSVVGVLTSAGLPYPVAASLVPIIIGNPPETSVGVSGPPDTTQMEQQEMRAAMEAFMQWVLNYFRLE
ncbi:hypothetical protein N7G274_007367 [Stereocaulon virgatum]|uniref:Glucose-methanol-choline oxidoreductase N-terminal domain-containing protein n=1 Tax=Stereocaulon virgatum TaxID=373712 RepID=A0ABR4A5B8_9LECA